MSITIVQWAYVVFCISLLAGQLTLICSPSCDTWLKICGICSLVALLALGTMVRAYAP